MFDHIPISKDYTLTYLYRGGNINTYKSIIKQGFDLSKIGTNYGLTLGKGIYFSPSKTEALGYSKDRLTILEIPVKLRSYKLSKSYSIDDKNHKKYLKKLKNNLLEKGYNSLTFSSKDFDRLYFICQDIDE